MSWAAVAAEKTEICLCFDLVLQLLNCQLIKKLTLQGVASGMDIKKGGAFKARPYKNPFRGPFGPIFLQRKGWGMKITYENFFKMGFDI